MNNQHLLKLAVLALASSLPASAAVIFSDDFGDGDRNGWISARPTNTAVTGNALTFDPDANDMVMRYFTPTTLASGDSLKITFDMSVNGAVPANTTYFRLGFFNSNSQTQKVDGFAVNSFSAAGAYAGSAALLNLTSGGTTSVTFRHRNLGTGTNVPAGENALTTNLANYVTAEPAATAGTVSAFEANKVYRVEYTFTEGGSSDTLAVSVFNVTDSVATGIAHSYVTNVATTNTFDLLAFNFQGTTTTVFSFDNVTLETVIPEPSSAAALAGLGALGLVGLRRRRR